MKNCLLKLIIPSTTLVLLIIIINSCSPVSAAPVPFSIGDIGKIGSDINKQVIQPAVNGVKSASQAIGNVVGAAVGAAAGAGIAGAAGIAQVTGHKDAADTINSKRDAISNEVQKATAQVVGTGLPAAIGLTTSILTVNPVGIVVSGIGLGEAIGETVLGVLRDNGKVDNSTVTTAAQIGGVSSSSIGLAAGVQGAIQAAQPVVAVAEVA